MRSAPGAKDAPRLAARDLLRAVAADGAYANLLLPRMLSERGITGRDAAFATELGYGALRMQGTLDTVIASAADRAASAIDADVLDVARLGTYQLLRMRVPAHAAVSTSVDLASPRSAGFVNAVLRRVSAADWDGWVAKLAPDAVTDPAGHLAVRYAHPRWVVRAFADALGGDPAATAAALAADNDSARVTLVAAGDRDELAAEVGGSPGRFSPLAVRLPGGEPGALPAVRQRRARVQDEGSQLVALAFATAPLPGPDSRWLDLTAGPGGKTATAGGIAARTGARIVAVDLHPHRAGLVARSSAGLPVEVVAADATTAPVTDGAFDRVLVDAPCSGLGALRRRPEARWRRAPGDLPALTRLQRDLLLAALTAVRPGGLVAYSTCSPHLAETVAVVADVSRRTGAQQVPAGPVLERIAGAPMRSLGAGPGIQLWPHSHDTDAMFLALLRRA